MKRKARPKVLRYNLKKETVKKARDGVFDHNPLLATSHKAVCKTCGGTHEITYLDHLKAGRFELGETQMIEVSYAAPSMLGLRHTVEKITRVIMTLRCDICGNVASYSPVSLEYLFFTTMQQHKLKNMYV